MQRKWISWIEYLILFTVFFHSNICLWLVYSYCIMEIVVFWGYLFFLEWISSGGSNNREKTPPQINKKCSLLNWAIILIWKYTSILKRKSDSTEDRQIPDKICHLHKKWQDLRCDYTHQSVIHELSLWQLW